MPPTLLMKDQLANPTSGKMDPQQDRQEGHSKNEADTDEDADTEYKSMLPSPLPLVTTASHNFIATTDDDEDDQLKPKYGFGSWQPDSLQFMANRKAFLVIFCMTCVLQGTFHTYFVAVITTLEKLFNIPSQTTGTLMMASEIGQMTSALLLPYYAGGGHRPHWMSFGSALFAFASLLCASPHLLIQTAEVDLLNENSAGQFCSAANNFTLCSDHESEDYEKKYFLFGIIFLSLLCIGFGQTAIFTLGIPYLDDNVKNRDSPMYFSITIGVRILGPVSGFILGSFCTHLYIDPFGDSPKDYGPTDPRWLGAWWLGMLLISFLLVFTSIIMSGFPRRLKQQEPNQLAAAQDQRPKLREFPQAIKRLLSNRILILRTFSSVFHLLPISGLYTFLPKYLESQFRLAAFQANIVAGIAGILVMGIGIFASGIFIRRKEPRAKNVALWVGMAALIYAGGMGALMGVGCEGSKGFVGIGKDFGQASCETDHCTECSSSIYAPVCGDDEQIFFSACHAGCPSDGNLNTSSYSNCSCTESAQPGLCPLTCPWFGLYLTIFMLIVLVHSTSEVGSMLLTLRCVEPRDKAMALGLIQCAIGLFGNVPCPVIYGAVVDKACVIWGEHKDCSNNTVRGHCWVYDEQLFRTYFHGLTGSLMFCGFLMDMLIWWHARGSNFLEQDPAGAAAAAPSTDPPPPSKEIEMENRL